MVNNALGFWLPLLRRDEAIHHFVHRLVRFVDNGVNVVTVRDKRWSKAEDVTTPLPRVIFKLKALSGRLCALTPVLENGESK